MELREEVDDKGGEADREGPRLIMCVMSRDEEPRRRDEYNEEYGV